MKQIFLPLALIAFGAILAITGHRQWSAAPERAYTAIEGAVLDHEVRVNRLRWEDEVPRAVEVRTRVAVRLEDGSSAGEAVVQSFFSNTDQAWKLAFSKPAGTQVSCLVAADLRHGVFASLAPSGDMVTVIIGSIILLIGVGLLLPFHPPAWVQPAFVSGILSLFFIAGVFMASQFWPAVVQHVKAATWDLVPCQVAAHRSFRSGKSTTHELLLRYTAEGRPREAVLNGSFFGLGVENRSARQCRVNPEKPWQVTLSWGWRPGLFVALFPVPFIAVGVLGLFSSGFQRRIPTGRRPQIQPHGRWGESAGQGFALVFVGSIIGVFASICAEMWLQEHGARWIFSLILLPFVVWLVMIARSFVSSVRKALRS